MQQPSNDFVDSKSSPENPLPDAQPKEHVLKTEEHPVHEAYQDNPEDQKIDDGDS